MAITDQGLCGRLYTVSLLGHANCTERCPVSGVTRKTCAHAEFFSVWPDAEVLCACR